MERLQGEGVRGADVVFACIGPALEVYRRYSRVVDAEDREIPLGGDPEAREPHLRGYLAYVWETVGRAALEQVLGSGSGFQPDMTGRMPVPQGALEEDARLTALFLWTLQSTEALAPEPAALTPEPSSLTPSPSPMKGEGSQVPSPPGGRGMAGGQGEGAGGQGEGAGGQGEGDGGQGEGEEEEEEDEDNEDAPRKKAKGFSLPFDVVRRFAQPLGIHLPEWEGRIIETEKGVVRLLPVAERAEGLFGRDGAQAVADRIEEDPRESLQLALFSASGETAAPKVRGRGRRKRTPAGGQVSDEALETRREATTLDRVHAALLLQKMGRTNALRGLLKAEQERGPDFIRLANALSALYPRGSEQRRLLVAMLQAVPR